MQLDIFVQTFAFIMWSNYHQFSFRPNNLPNNNNFQKIVHFPIQQHTIPFFNIPHHPLNSRTISIPLHNILSINCIYFINISTKLQENIISSHHIEFTIIILFISLLKGCTSVFGVCLIGRQLFLKCFLQFSGAESVI